MRLYTAEEYEELGEEYEHHELVRGVLVREVRDSPQGPHGYTAGMLAYFLNQYLETHPIGVVFVEPFYLTERRPDTVRLPDVSYVSYDHLKGKDPWKLNDTVHDIATEIVSPSNRPGEIAQKLAEYLAKGTRLVWVVDPKTRTVVVHAPEAITYVVRSGEFLDAGDVLPEFRVEVKKLFGWPPP
jgi:Uma2 family endonuclease